MEYCFGLNPLIGYFLRAEFWDTVLAFGGAAGTAYFLYKAAGRKELFVVMKEELTFLKKLQHNIILAKVSVTSMAMVAEDLFENPFHPNRHTFVNRISDYAASLKTIDSLLNSTDAYLFLDFDGPVRRNFMAFHHLCDRVSGAQHEGLPTIDLRAAAAALIDKADELFFLCETRCAFLKNNLSGS